MRKKRNWFGIGAVAIFFIGGVIGFTNITSLEKADKELQEIEQELKIIQTSIIKPNETNYEEVTLAMNSATDIGEQIAVIQNQAIQDMVNGDTEAYEVTVIPLLSHFTDRAFTGLWFPIKEEIASWKFETSYDTTLTRIPVIWSLSMNESEELLALVRGMYSVEEQTFQDLVMYTTRYSASVTAVTGEINETEKEVLIDE